MLAHEFGDNLAISVQQDSETRGAFEVELSGELIHSKLSVSSHGRCETATETAALLQKIREALE